MPTTTSAEPGSLAFQIQFIHPEKILSTAVEPRAIEDHISPLFHGAEASAVAEMRARFAESVAETATALLDDRGFRDELERLPFAERDVVVALGDSLTDDLQSWATILGEALRQLHGEAAPVIVNAGRSGDTTTHLLERLPTILATQPDWVIVLVGTNDGKAFGYDPTRSLVSPGESAENTRTIHTVLEASDARVTWVLPPLADEATAAACAFWEGADLVWSNEHLSRTRAALASAIPVAVDLGPVFEAAGVRSHLLHDGLHPNLAGQVLIIRAVCRALVGAEAMVA